MSDEKGETEPAIGVSLNANLSPTKQIVLQTHVPVEWTEEQINKLVDKLSGVIDRKEAYYRIEILEAELEQNEQALYSINDNLANVEKNALMKWEASNKRRPFEWSGQELIQKKQAEDTVVRQTKIVKQCRDRLTEAKRKAGVDDGTASSANS
jgi:regulator of replication initiation timing